jgi:hypothetical protein
MRYGLNTKRLRRTVHNVVFNIDSFLAAVPVYFFGLGRKLARTRSTSYSAVNGQPLDFCLQRHPISVNYLYHARMVLSVGGSFARNARCTVTTDLLVYYNTQNNFSTATVIFSLHILATPSGRNVNCDKKNNLLEKKLSCSFHLYRFHKYVSYGFPIINFCNPAAHNETLCIFRATENFIMGRTGMLKITYVFFHRFVAYTLLKERRKSRL